MFILFCILLGTYQLSTASELIDSVLPKDSKIDIIFFLSNDIVAQYLYRSVYTENNQVLQKDFVNYLLGEKDFVLRMPNLAQTNKHFQKIFIDNYNMLAKHYVTLHFIENINNFNTSKFRYQCLFDKLQTIKFIYRIENFFKNDKEYLKKALWNVTKVMEREAKMNSIQQNLKACINTISTNLVALKIIPYFRDIHEDMVIQSFIETISTHINSLNEKIQKNQTDKKNLKNIKNSSFVSDNEKNTLEKTIKKVTKKIGAKLLTVEQYSNNVKIIEKNITNINDLLKKNNALLNFYNIDPSYTTTQDLKSIQSELQKKIKYQYFDDHTKAILLGLILNVFAKYDFIAYQNIFLPNTPDYQKNSENLIIMQQSSDTFFDPIYYTFLRVIFKKKDIPEQVHSKSNTEAINFFKELIASTSVPSWVYQLALFTTEKTLFIDKKIKDLYYLLKAIDIWLPLEKKIKLVIIKSDLNNKIIVKNLYQKNYLLPYLKEPIELYTEKKSSIIPIPLFVMEDIVNNSTSEYTHLFSGKKTYYLLFSDIQKKLDDLNEREILDIINKFLKKHNLLLLFNENNDLTNKPHSFYHAINLVLQIPNWTSLIKSALQETLDNNNSCIINIDTTHNNKQFNIDNKPNLIDFMCNLCTNVSVNYCEKSIKRTDYPKNLTYNMPQNVNLLLLLNNQITNNMNWQENTLFFTDSENYNKLLTTKIQNVRFPNNAFFHLYHNNSSVACTNNSDIFFNPIELLNLMVNGRITNNTLSLLGQNDDKFLNFIYDLIQQNQNTVKEFNYNCIHINEVVIESENKKALQLFCAPCKKIIIDASHFPYKPNWQILNIEDNIPIVIQFQEETFGRGYEFSTNKDLETYKNLINKNKIRLDWSNCKTILMLSFQTFKKCFKNLKSMIPINSLNHTFIVYLGKNNPIRYCNSTTCKNILDKNILFYHHSNSNRVTLTDDAFKIIYILLAIGFNQETIINTLKKEIYPPKLFDSIIKIYIPPSIKYSPKKKETLSLLHQLFLNAIIKPDKRHPQYKNIIEYSVKTEQSTDNNQQNYIRLILYNFINYIKKTALFLSRLGNCMCQYFFSIINIPIIFR